MIIDIPEDDYNPDVNNCSDNKDDYDSYYEDVYIMMTTITHLIKGNQHLPEEVVLGEAIPVIDLRETTNLPFQIVPIYKERF